MAAQPKGRIAGRPIGRSAPLITPQFKVRIPPSSIAVICREAGFRDDREAFDAKGYPEIAVAIAICFAESRFYADATNRSSAGVANGLFQIMQPSVNPNLLDGQTNARLAYQMYEREDIGGGAYRFFGPWAGSNWRPHISMAMQLAQARRDMDPSAGDNFRDFVGGIPNPLDAFDEVTDFLKVLFSGALWLRIVFILGGAILAFIALNTMLKQFGVSVPLPYGATLGK